MYRDLLNQPYTNTKKQKELIIEELRNSGCRVTRQRMILLDIILNSECVSCKDIHCQALHKDRTIGIATVYRMINKLEEIGAINRTNQYKISNEKYDETHNERIVLHRNDLRVAIKDRQWIEEIQSKLRHDGYINNEPISIVINIE